MFNGETLLAFICMNYIYFARHTLKRFMVNNCGNIRLREKSILRLNKKGISLYLIRRFSTNKLSSKDKKEFELSSHQKNALIGIILGDGFLERNKPSHNTRLRIEQSYPEKEKYLNSLYE